MWPISHIGWRLRAATWRSGVATLTVLGFAFLLLQGVMRRRTLALAFLALAAPWYRA